MSADLRHRRLIDRLARSLGPVARLAAPWRRMLGWAAVVGLATIALMALADLRAVVLRFASEPMLTLATLGSLVTAGSAAFAAILTALPDRDARWAALPLPGLALWIGASLVDGFEAGDDPGHRASLSESCRCAAFILGLGVPFALVLTATLRRGYALRPGRTAALAGLAAASVAASLLGLFHPFETTPNDLAVHAASVALLSGGCTALGGRLLRRAAPPAQRG